ncbi:MAG: hypothetical protein HRF48_15460 [Chloroflexota bacterium]|jgi:hypothetical protein
MYPDDEIYDDYPRKTKRHPPRDVPPNLAKVLLALIGTIGGGLVLSLVLKITFAPELTWNGIFFGASDDKALVVTATPQDNISTPFVAPSTSGTGSSSRPHLEEQDITGVGVRKEYSLVLDTNEALVGDAYDVEDRRTAGCDVFWKRGPASVDFSVFDGAWYRYSNVTTESQLQDLIDGRYNYLANSHWFCKNTDVAVLELGGD